MSEDAVTHKIYDVVIIGAGIAGMTAAIYLSRANKSVLVIEEKIYGGQIINTVNIENWPGDMGVSGADLSQKIYHQMDNLGAGIEYAEVLGIERAMDAACFVVKTDDGDYLCRAVIIATGTEPRKLSEKQTKDAGKRPISYCATCDGALYKGKKVVVVGSGNTAKHEMTYLRNIASEVYHIHHDDPIPEDAEGIFVAIGRVPNTKCVEGVVDLDEKGYVVASEDCQTSQEGIFVAGDCRTKTTRQLVTAAGDGAVAAGAVVDYLNDRGQ